MCIGIGSYTKGALNSKDPDSYSIAVRNFEPHSNQRKRRSNINDSIDDILSDSIEKSIEGKGETDFDCENSFIGVSKKLNSKHVLSNDGLN